MTRVGSPEGAMDAGCSCSAPPDTRAAMLSSLRDWLSIVVSFWVYKYLSLCAAWRIIAAVRITRAFAAACRHALQRDKGQPEVAHFDEHSMERCLVGEVSREERLAVLHVGYGQR